MKQIYLIYPLLLGCVFAYMISGLIRYELGPVVHPMIIPTSKQTKITHKIDLEEVIKKNVFEVKIGGTEKIREIRKIDKGDNEVNTDIDGYKLIGFVAGSAPMVLFKKENRPVVIVDKNTLLEKRWMLEKIEEETVYLKNKKTGEIRTFKLAASKAGLFSSQKVINTPNIERFKIDKKLVEKELKDLNRFLKEVRIGPYFENGKTVGYKLSYLSPTCILRKIGLRQKDVIVSINGEPANDPKKMMDLYTQLLNMTSVNLDILRGGEKKTIFIEVE